MVKMAGTFRAFLSSRFRGRANGTNGRANGRMRGKTLKRANGQMEANGGQMDGQMVKT
jgi:hypothetical protein